LGDVPGKWTAFWRQLMQLAAVNLSLKLLSSDEVFVQNAEKYKKSTKTSNLERISKPMLLILTRIIAILNGKTPI
jgi:hypothetical protein